MDQVVAVTIYPHTTLFSLAFHHRETIKRRLASGEREGIAFDSASCIVALAFVVEGILNVVGNMLVEGWNERHSYEKKLAQCCGVLGVTDTSGEPFLTLGKLKIFRDQIAHPKPIEKRVQISNARDVFSHMDAEWEAACDPTFAIEAFAQVDAFERMVLEHPSVGKHAFMTEADGVIGY